MIEAPTQNELQKPDRKIAKFCAWTMIVLGLFLIVVYWIQPDRLAPITMVPSWCWLVPFLIGCALVRHRSLYYVIAVWIVFTCLHIEQIKSLARLGLPEKHDSQTTIRVASLNCNVGNRDAATEVLATNSDIYLIQESPSENDLRALGFDDINIPMNFVWSTDTSIAVRGEIKAKHIAAHFCHVVAKLSSGQQIDIVCLRLSAPVFRLDFWSSGFWTDHYQKRIHHRQQLDEIIEHLNKNQQTPHLIIGGDFNSVGRDGAMTTTLKNCRDSFAVAGRGWGETGTNEFPIFRVDQIWASNNISWMKSQSIKTMNSDHRMVVAEFALDK